MTDKVSDQWQKEVCQEIARTVADYYRVEKRAIYEQDLDKYPNERYTTIYFCRHYSMDDHVIAEVFDLREYQLKHIQQIVRDRIEYNPSFRSEEKELAVLVDGALEKLG